MRKIKIITQFTTVTDAHTHTLKRCTSHSALGMMVKGRMGLLASSSRAVRKHSVAAAALPCACSTSPRLFQTSWAVLQHGKGEKKFCVSNEKTDKGKRKEENGEKRNSHLLTCTASRSTFSDRL